MSGLEKSNNVDNRLYCYYESAPTVGPGKWYGRRSLPVADDFSYTYSASVTSHVMHAQYTQPVNH